MPASEFTYWQAFYDLEPFGDEWSQAALMPTLYANAHRKEGGQTWELADFMPERSRTFEVQRIKEGLMRAFSAFGLKRKDRDG